MVRRIMAVNKSVILRLAVLSDQGMVFSMHVQLFREHIDAIWGWDEEWQNENFHKEWDEAVTEIIEVEGTILGYIQTRQNSAHLYILNFALCTKYQSRGVGTRVMNILKERAESQSLPIELNVFKTNQRVIKFYQRLEFIVQEETETG